MFDWFSEAPIREVGLFLLAIYAAILSTFNWIATNRKDKQRISLQMGTAMPVNFSGDLGPSFVKVEAVNIGHRPVTISTLTIEIAPGRRLFKMNEGSFPSLRDSKLPMTLKDGEAAQMFCSYQDIGSALSDMGVRKQTKIWPVCVDNAGRLYKGRAWKIDPAEYLRM